MNILLSPEPIQIPDAGDIGGPDNSTSGWRLTSGMVEEFSLSGSATETPATNDTRTMSIPLLKSLFPELGTAAQMPRIHLVT